MPHTPPRTQPLPANLVRLPRIRKPSAQPRNRPRKKTMPNMDAYFRFLADPNPHAVCPPGFERLQLMTQDQRKWTRKHGRPHDLIASCINDPRHKDYKPPPADCIKGEGGSEAPPLKSPPHNLSTRCTDAPVSPRNALVRAPTVQGNELAQFLETPSSRVNTDVTAPPGSARGNGTC